MDDLVITHSAIPFHAADKGSAKVRNDNLPETPASKSLTGDRNNTFRISSFRRWQIVCQRVSLYCCKRNLDTSIFPSLLFITGRTCGSPLQAHFAMSPKIIKQYHARILMKIAGGLNQT